MSSFHSAFLCILAIALPGALGGCAVAVIGGLAGAGATGYAVGQERGLTGGIDDFTIRQNVQEAWAQAQPSVPTDLGITVYEGRVLLTGNVPTPELKVTAEQAASRSEGVRAVYNEIEVGPGAGTWDGTKDAWITTRVRSDLVFDSDIRSLNYTIETANRSVYLIGSARTQAELERATSLARNIPGVRRVVSYVEVRPGAPSVAQPAMPPPHAQASGVPEAAPAEPVEAHRL